MTPLVFGLHGDLAAAAAQGRHALQSQNIHMEFKCQRLNFHIEELKLFPPFFCPPYSCMHLFVKVYFVMIFFFMDLYISGHYYFYTPILVCSFVMYLSTFYFMQLFPYLLFLNYIYLSALVTSYFSD